MRITKKLYTTSSYIGIVSILCVFATVWYFGPVNDIVCELNNFPLNFMPSYLYVSNVI